MQTVVIPTPFTWFGCKYPQIKADSLQLKHILLRFIWKSIVVVYRAKNVRIVSMSPIFMDLTVCNTTSSAFSAYVFGCPVVHQSMDAVNLVLSSLLRIDGLLPKFVSS